MVDEASSSKFINNLQIFLIIRSYQKIVVFIFGSARDCEDQNGFYGMIGAIAALERSLIIILNDKEMGDRAISKESIIEK